MKLKRKLFDSLNAEMDQASRRAFNFQLAIEALQNVCDHEWKEDSTHGYTEDPRTCGICGKMEVAENE